MHSLLNIQLKKVYGKTFKLDIQDEKFKEFAELVQNAYRDFEENESFLDTILEVNAKELEESNYLLYRKKELLKSVKNSMDDAIFYKNLEHKYIGCNEKFAEFLGICEEDLIGKSDYDFFDTQTANRYREINEDIIKNKTKVSYEQWVDFQGRQIYVLTRKTALVDNNGKVIGIVGVSKDITNEYELQKDLERKNIMLIQQNKLVSMGEMIANIAHQWRQPLNALNLLVQKMGIYYKEGLLSDTQVDKNTSEALQLIEGMSETIDDFRNFFKPAKVFEDFSIEEAVKKSHMIIKPILEQNKINFIMSVKDSYFVSGYKNEFFQVLLNLLNNAAEALVQDKINAPKISLHARAEKKSVIIDICDNANGINSADIGKIFDPYFTTKESGTGLGLYMSKIIIEEHMKGKLSVQSNYLGTTFTIVLGGVLN